MPLTACRFVPTAESFAHATPSTFAPRIFPAFSSARARLASSRGYSSTSGRRGIPAASSRNSAMSRRAKFATLLIYFSSQRCMGYSRRISSALSLFLPDGVDHEPSSGGKVPQGLNDGLPCGRRVDNRIKFFRGFRLRGSRPGGAQFTGECAFTLAPGENEDFDMGEAAPDFPRNRKRLSE
jgi:hypothetical protein